MRNKKALISIIGSILDEQDLGDFWRKQYTEAEQLEVIELTLKTLFTLLQIDKQLTEMR